MPAGAPAFKVDLAGGGDAVGAGQIRFLRWHPYGLGIDSNAVSNCYIRLGVRLHTGSDEPDGDEPAGRVCGRSRWTRGGTPTT